MRMRLENLWLESFLRMRSEETEDDDSPAFKVTRGPLYFSGYRGICNLWGLLLQRLSFTMFPLKASRMVARTGRVAGSIFGLGGAQFE